MITMRTIMQIQNARCTVRIRQHKLNSDDGDDLAIATLFGKRLFFFSKYQES